jgi:hypothetical protein
VQGSASFGREISRSLTSESSLESEKFQKLVSGQVNDQLMVTYLSHLTRAQIVLAENISQILAAQQVE